MLAKDDGMNIATWGYILDVQPVSDKAWLRNNNVHDLIF
jgi:hypothetical protein